MSVHIVVRSPWGVQRVYCYEGLATAVQMASLLHRKTGREVEVVETDEQGKETCKLFIDTISLPLPPAFF